MSKTFWRWKNPNCNGENIEWVEMTRDEFKAFIRSDEHHGRYFIRLGNEICYEADIIFIEATYDQYRDWYREMQHHFYLRRANPGYSEASMDCISEDSDLSMHELIASAGFSPEEIIVKNETINIIRLAISTLSEKNQAAILAKFYWYPGRSDEEIAELLGMSSEVFAKRKYRALCQLENFLKEECPIF